MMHALRHMREGRRPLLALGAILLVLFILGVPIGIASSFRDGGGRALARPELSYASLPEADLSGRFRGLACMGSCASHAAGYAWAEGNARQFQDCHGHNWAFAEGCIAFLHENPPTT